MAGLNHMEGYNMNKLIEKDAISILNERTSVRKYDPTHKMSKQDIKELLELAHKAPSAWNLQHWKFLVFDDQAVKEQLLPIAYGQQQVVESSIVVAVLADLEANKNVKDVYEKKVQEGMLPANIAETLINQIEQAYKDPSRSRDSAFINSSLAAMQLMLAAKALGYDTVAMGGFDSKKLIEAFNIPSRYVPNMLISVGKAVEPGRPSDRLPIDDVIVWNSFK
jgi:nitroreductase